MSSRANALPPPELGVVIKNLWGIRSAPPMGCHPDPFGGPWGVGTGARKPIGGVRSKFSRPPPARHAATFPPFKAGTPGTHRGRGQGHAKNPAILSGRAGATHGRAGTKIIII